METNPSRDQPPTNKPATHALWIWIYGSGAGASVGAIIALILFPSAGFARNPTGQFGWHLVGFALAIGISFAVSQWLILRYAPRYQNIVDLPNPVLWVLVSSVGIAAMILPLYYWDASTFMNAPWYVAKPMLPGMFFLGIGQWLVLYRGNASRLIWVLFTIIGGMTGAVLGLVLSFFIPLPLEVSWTFITAAGIGALQWFVLFSGIGTKRG